MSIRIFLITALYCITVSVYAQENISGLKKDSLKTLSNEYVGSENPTVKPFAVKEEMPDIKPETDIPQMEIQEIRLRRPFYMPYYTNPSPMFYGDIAPNLYGYGSQSILPGIGRINEASLMYRYDINDFWEIQGGVNATKYNFPFSTGQAFGAAGALIYRPTDKLSFRAFGSYAPTSAYGFYMTKIGLDVGGILYEIVRSVKFKNQGGNPTIMPGR